MVTRIIQIAGSLDKRYRELEFSIEGQRYGPYKLVASALAEHLRNAGKECAVTLLVPESLIAYMASSPDEAEVLLEDRERFAEEAKRRLREVVGTDFEVMVLQGLGRYGLDQKDGQKANLEFENSIGNVSSYALVELTEHSDRDEELIFCTSTGYNAYLLAVQTALSVYYAYRTIIDQASGKNGSGRFVLRTAYHPPPPSEGMKMPVESEGMETPVELEETRHRAFFDFPELSAQLVTDRTSKAIELKRRLHRLKEEMEAERSKASLAFNAVKYNAPLVLHYLEQPDGRKILRSLREALAEIEGARSVVKDGSTVRVRRFRVSRGEVSGWVITAALSTYLSEVISSVRSKDRRLKGILEVMGSVYKDQRLEVNKYVLEHEADQIAKAAEDMRPGERRLLREVLKLGGSGNPKRNFFAHAGLLADRTYVTRTEEGDVVLEYDENRLKEIMGWVRDPTP